MGGLIGEANWLFQFFNESQSFLKSTKELIFGQKQSVLPLFGALPSSLIFLAATKCYFCFISEFVEEISGKGCATFECLKRYAMLTMT